MMVTSLRGVALRGAIIGAELIAFVYLNSSSLLLDAISSLIDIAASLFLIFCIKIADKPPDEEHPFGHGRFEPIAGLQLGLMLVAIGGGMLFQQLSALAKGGAARAIDPLTCLVPIGAIILLEISYRILKKTAERENSPALLADAVHYRIDSLNSLFAAVALIFAAFFPRHSVAIDHWGAVLIALFMIGMGIYAARNNLHQLLDRTPDKSYFEKVRDAAMKVPGCSRPKR